ncbi:helix-turn-helix domain-containing protein [Terrimonas rubra]|uniref:Helix-turn-helix domain-containing protein n=1 Tax=Terrimonas rubra TaxID=1035890 RepID=A0ABW6A4L8_9BACT
MEFSGADLQNLRLIKKLTQEGVAAKLGFTQQYYSKLEKKERIDTAIIEKILLCLNATKEDLHVLKQLGG